MTIKFIGNEIGDITAYKGFETSFEFMKSVANGGYYINGNQLVNAGYCKIEIGDYLFDYETGTMWEVME